MPYKDLQDYLEALEKQNELEPIDKPVNPDLEIATLTNLVSKQCGPALLFKKLPGYDIPVLTNAFGSMKRMILALKITDLDSLGQQVVEFIEAERLKSIVKKTYLKSVQEKLASNEPKMIQNAPCQEIILQAEEKIDLYSLPILKCWPRDGGRAITLPLVFTKHPETGIRNVGIYRMQVFDKKTTGMHWRPGSGGATHYLMAKKLGRKLEVAVAIGPDPAMTYAATAPLPPNIDETHFAGFLRKAPVEMVKCKTVDMEIPACSQIILEGYINPDDTRIEGPFGNHTGYYSPPEHYPVFHVTCITMRKDAIYPATVVGPPPAEDCFMAKVTERLFLPFLRQTFPEIMDINMPIEGIFNNLAFVAIDKRYPGHAIKITNALWGLGPLMLHKIICIFDKDVNVQDLSQVLWKLGNNIDPARDVFFSKGPVDTLNPATVLPSYGSKMGIDCTRKWKDEGLEKTWPPSMAMDKNVKKRMEALLKKINMTNTIGNG